MSSLEPAASPATRKSVFLDTDPEALPPRTRIASFAESREKPSSEPVTTTVRPSSVRGVDSSCSSSMTTPAAAHRSTISRCQSSANHSMSASAMIGPTPSISASRSRSPASAAARSAAIEPNAVASERAAVGPTCRMDSATRVRHSGCDLAFSSSSNRRSVLAVGADGFFAVPAVKKYGLSVNTPEGTMRPSTFVRPSRHTRTAPRERCRSVSPSSPRGPVISSGVPEARSKICASAVMGPGPSGRTCPSCSAGSSPGPWTSQRAASSPSASTSKAPRLARCSTRPASWAGQERALGQRRSTSPSLAGASGVPHEGQCAGMTNSRSSRPASIAFSRSGSTGPTTSGITSPALRTTTVSPINTPLALTTSWLCRVARETVDPATVTGSITANGVTRPVRPTETAMSRSSVCTSSGGYLYATAQRGTREVWPR